MEGSDPDRIAQPEQKRPGPNPVFFSVLVALGLAVLVAILLGERGRVAGSGLAFALVAGAIAFGVFYVVILAIRESWSRRMLNIGLPLGTKAEQRPPDPQNVAQHEAITRQAKAMETVSSSYREQLHTTTEQLKSQTERADRLESEKKRLVEENAQLRRGPTPGNGD